jgi:hypothetical protein
MKNAKLLPVNQIGVYKDTDGTIYNAKVLGILIFEDDKDPTQINLRAISEFDLKEGYFDIKEDDGFLNLQK